MSEAENLKALVREKYGAIAAQSSAASGCCSGTSCCGPSAQADAAGEFAAFNEDYTALKGYVAEADLGLGCGLPTGTAAIRPGDTVVDLGSGAGNDVFVARGMTGETGRVIGVDMTSEMVAKARANNAKLGYVNVEFRLGEIENLPIEADTADWIISNCVLNLVPNKTRAFAEMHRVLKPGGCFSVSDIVLAGTLPEALRRAAEMYVGCVSGALPRTEYLGLIEAAGFAEVRVERERAIELPEEVLRQYLTSAEMEVYQSAGVAIVSITVTGRRSE